MTRRAFFIDLSICAGCEACTVACQNLNGLPPDQCFTGVERRTFGRFPDVTSTPVVRQCLHCDDPPCAQVCPTGATQKQADGPVTVDPELCIGCQYCMSACPYGARVPDPASGTVRKCSLCIDRLARDQQPACVQTCLTGARAVGDLDNPADPIHAAVAQPDTVQVAGTSFFFRLPAGMARAVLPPDFQGAGVIYAWQSILQPLGQVLMGSAAAAAVVSLAAHALKAVRKEDDDHGDG